MIVAYPTGGEAAGLALAAIETIAGRYAARHASSLNELLHREFPPVWRSDTRGGAYRPPIALPFQVDLVELPTGAELSFADELRSEYLSRVLRAPALVPALNADRNLRLAVSPNWRLHASGVPEAVPEPFTIGSNHSRYLSQTGLAGAGPSEAAGVTVAVLDNGFDSAFWQGAPMPVPVSSGQDLIAGDPSTSGHGTLVAAIIGSSAPGADVVPIRMAGEDSTEWDTLHALAQAVRLQADVITISYRQILVDQPCDTCGMVRQAARSEVFERLVEWAAAGGRRAILAAAGNDGAPPVARPAAYPGAIAVAALDQASSGLAHFSNWDAAGSVRVIAMPGEDVAHSTVSARIYEGTSFATAYAAALYAVAMGRWSTRDAAQVTAQLTVWGSKVKNAIVARL